MNIGGADWRVIEATPAEVPELENQQGLCKPDKQIIYINTDETPPEGRAFVLAHEVGHASIFMSGTREGLKTITGLKGTKFDALEEYIVCAMFHSVYDTFVRNGWLKIQ